MITALLTVLNEEIGTKLGVMSFFALSVFSLFQLAWFITGAVLYWGNLDKEKVCDAMTIGYMFSILILGFLAFIANGIVGVKSFLTLKR